MKITVLNKTKENIFRYIYSKRIRDVFIECLELEGDLILTECQSVGYVVQQYNTLLQKDEVYIFFYLVSNTLEFKSLLTSVKQLLSLDASMDGYVEIYKEELFDINNFKLLEDIQEFIISKSLHQFSPIRPLHPYNVFLNNGHYNEEILSCLKTAHITGLKGGNEPVQNMDSFLESIENLYCNLDEYISFVITKNQKFIGHATFEKNSASQVHMIDSFIIDKSYKKIYNILIEESLTLLKNAGFEKASGSLCYEGKDTLRKLTNLLNEGWIYEASIIKVKGRSRND